ncbi:hypothetical protein [Heliorestis acidaminivorans]|uniref:hypothetical protein n=1 Tax=Heliorestis acidaminivorans TaxID=553427 RepID=UPI00147982CD|nr:hypothetical protein [Heliorestis acidaminivorans]
MYQHGIDGLLSIVPQPMTLDDAINSAEELLLEATIRMCRLIRVGEKMAYKKEQKRNKSL